MTATIKRAGENDVLYEFSKEMMQMAPNSNFNFPISLEGDCFCSWNYLLELTAKSGENEWSWTREFPIFADDACKLNQSLTNSDDWFNRFGYSFTWRHFLSTDSKEESKDKRARTVRRSE